jgi:hypothetical protein
MKCEQFLALPIEDRSTLVRGKRVCFNCLRTGHSTPKCPSRARRVHCRRSHHSLLHLEVDRVARRIVNPELGSSGSTPPVASTSFADESTIVAHVRTEQATVPRGGLGILSTAWVDLHTVEGRRVPVRALINLGSTLSFISESL